jgi:hypothetical protein
MIKLSTLALAAGLALVGTAHAQSAGPQIPNPANPFPEEAIATDGSRLVLGSATNSMSGFDRLRSGRSVAHDVDVDSAR